MHRRHIEDREQLRGVAKDGENAGGMGERSRNCIGIEGRFALAGIVLKDSLGKFIGAWLIGAYFKMHMSRCNVGGNTGARSLLMEPLRARTEGNSSHTMWPSNGAAAELKTSALPQDNLINGIQIMKHIERCKSSSIILER